MQEDYKHMPGQMKRLTTRDDKGKLTVILQMMDHFRGAIGRVQLNPPITPKVLTEGVIECLRRFITSVEITMRYQYGEDQPDDTKGTS